jgi:hypothetical protein
MLKRVGYVALIIGIGAPLCYAAVVMSCWLIGLIAPYISSDAAMPFVLYGSGAAILGAMFGCADEPWLGWRPVLYTALLFAAMACILVGVAMWGPTIDTGSHTGLLLGVALVIGFEIVSAILSALRRLAINLIAEELTKGQQRMGQEWSEPSWAAPAYHDAVPFRGFKGFDEMRQEIFKSPFMQGSNSNGRRGHHDGDD